MKPEFIPDVGDEIDVGNFDESFTNEQPVNSLVSTDLLLLSKFEKEFKGLDFNSSISESKSEQSVVSEVKKEEEAPTQVMFKKKKG